MNICQIAAQPYSIIQLSFPLRSHSRRMGFVTAVPARRPRDTKRQGPRPRHLLRCTTACHVPVPRSPLFQQTAPWCPGTSATKGAPLPPSHPRPSAIPKRPRDPLLSQLPGAAMGRLRDCFLRQVNQGVISSARNRLAMIASMAKECGT